MFCLRQLHKLMGTASQEAHVLQLYARSHKMLQLVRQSLRYKLKKKQPKGARACMGLHTWDTSDSRQIGFTSGIDWCSLARFLVKGWCMLHSAVFLLNLPGALSGRPLAKHKVS